MKHYEVAAAVAVAAKMDLSLNMWMNIPNVVYHHYKEGNLNTFMCIYIPACHVLGMYGLIAYGPKAMAETWIWTYMVYYMTGE